MLALVAVTGLLFNCVEGIALMPSFRVTPKVEPAKVRPVGIAETIKICGPSDYIHHYASARSCELFNSSIIESDVFVAAEEYFISRSNIDFGFRETFHLQARGLFLCTELTEYLIQEFFERMSLISCRPFWCPIRNKSKIVEFLDRWCPANILDSNVNENLAIGREIGINKCRNLSDQIWPLIDFKSVLLLPQSCVSGVCRLFGGNCGLFRGTGGLPHLFKLAVIDQGDNRIHNDASNTDPDEPPLSGFNIFLKFLYGIVWLVVGTTIGTYSEHALMWSGWKHWRLRKRLKLFQVLNGQGLSKTVEAGTSSSGLGSRALSLIRPFLIDVRDSAEPGRLRARFLFEFFHPLSAI